MKTMSHVDGAHAVGNEQHLRLDHRPAGGEDGAVDIPEQTAHEYGAEYGAHLPQGIDQRNGYHAAQGDDAHHGKVDKAADDDKRHAQRYKRQRPELAQHVREIGGAGELRLDDGRNHDQEHDDDEHKVVGYDPGNGLVLFDGQF